MALFATWFGKQQPSEGRELPEVKLPKEEVSGAMEGETGHLSVSSHVRLEGMAVLGTVRGAEVLRR